MSWDEEGRFTTTINRVHVHKKGQTIYVQHFTSDNIKKRKKNPEGCRLLYWLISSGPLIYSSPVWCSAVDICLTDVWRGTSDSLQILIQTHRQSRSVSKLEKKWWKCIHYKVMMKFPAGSLERQYFQEPWAGCALCILHLFYTLIWEEFTFLKATIGSLSPVITVPMTVLKWERKFDLEWRKYHRD